MNIKIPFQSDSDFEKIGEYSIHHSSNHHYIQLFDGQTISGRSGEFKCKKEFISDKDKIELSHGDVLRVKEKKCSECNQGLFFNSDKQEYYCPCCMDEYKNG